MWDIEVALGLPLLQKILFVRGWTGCPMIYLLRHGETVWNTAGRYQGQKDSSLTRRGIEQADQLGRRLAREIAGREEDFEIHVSPLGRAKETAVRIAHSIPLPASLDGSDRRLVGRHDALRNRRRNILEP